MSSIHIEEAKQNFINNYNKLEDIFHVASLSNTELVYLILGIKSTIYNTVCNSPFKIVADVIMEYHKKYYRDLRAFHDFYKESVLSDMNNNLEEVITDLLELDSVSANELLQKDLEDAAINQKWDIDDARELANSVGDELALASGIVLTGEIPLDFIIRLGRFTAEQLQSGVTLVNWKSYYEGHFLGIQYTEKEKELLKPLFESPYLDALDDWKAYAKGECELEDLLPITEVEAEEDAESSITNEEAQEVVTSKIEQLKGIEVLAKNRDGREIDREALIEWIERTCSPKIEGTWGCLGLYYVLKHYRFIDSTNDIGKTNFQKLLKSLGIKVPPKFNDAQNMAGCLIIKDDKLIDNAYDIWMNKYKKAMENYRNPQLTVKGANNALETIRIILEELKFTPRDFIM